MIDVADLLHGRDRCLVMGIVNVTDDSFSDGGRWADPISAAAHARVLLAAGADIIDVGGESTRPGAVRVPEERELARVVPVVRELAADGVAVSVDTMRASVAEACLEAGAAIVNDVSGGLADPRMLEVCAGHDAAVCLMHWRTDRFGSASGRAEPDPRGIVAEVRDHLLARAEAAEAAGIPRDRLILDPGLGFAKNADDNWTLLKELPELVGLGVPVLVGASRKRFVATVVDGGPRAPREADSATAAVTALAADRGAWAVRVHDVAPSRAAVAVAAAWGAGRGPAGVTADGDYPAGGGNRPAAAAPAAPENATENEEGR
ncbi:dihydropteroate synthase [Corynebacterium sp.]|uniref:dihydropteroate synthase n=1 Tax=Corynebacterium sp. TaxID=1720 RepID=UPI0026DB7E8D|nr:dihydropteroate synthase [Corynebacterium sp.]MDO4609704.1 dihydropteroate synthase [Corynebacterium sp.]